MFLWSSEDFFKVNFNKSLRKYTIRVSYSLNPYQSPYSVVPELLPTFANSLDPDQAQQNIRPDLDPNWLRLIVFLKYLFEKANFEKTQMPRLIGVLSGSSRHSDGSVIH